MRQQLQPVTAPLIAGYFSSLADSGSAIAASGINSGGNAGKFKTALGFVAQFLYCRYRGLTLDEVLLPLQPFVS